MSFMAENLSAIKPFNKATCWRQRVKECFEERKKKEKKSENYILGFLNNVDK